MNTTTTMNTGAARLSDERERAAITACALMIKGICLTRPNAEWTGAIEDRIQFMLKQMQAGAAIAAGGAQEAGAFDHHEVDHGTHIELVPHYAALLPRVAAPGALTDEQMMAAIKSVCGFDAEKAEQWRPEALTIGRAVERALLAASNGEQA